ncbi:uncharacterized [Tachysurus ichikawai]
MLGHPDLHQTFHFIIPYITTSAFPVPENQRGSSGRFPSASSMCASPDEQDVPGHSAATLQTRSSILEVTSPPHEGLLQ